MSYKKHLNDKFTEVIDSIKSCLSFITPERVHITGEAYVFSDIIELLLLLYWSICNPCSYYSV